MPSAIIKVHGWVIPVFPEDLPALQAGLALLGKEAAGALELHGQILNLAYTGIFFPLENFFQALASLPDRAGRSLCGKIDYFDLENWLLTRYLAENNGAFRASPSRSLNDVLAYSGH